MDIIRIKLKIGMEKVNETELRNIVIKGWARENSKIFIKVVKIITFVLTQFSLIISVSFS